MKNMSFFAKKRMYLRELCKDTLLVNALYLMLSTFVVAITGFVFWIVVAHTHDPATVGLATTLLSVSALLSLLGLAGFDTTFVRFLHRSKHKQAYINSGFTVVTVVSGGLAICFAVLLPILSPQLLILRSAWPFVGFVVFTVIAALNILTNAVFLAYRKAHIICAINVIFSVFKVALTLVFTKGGAMMIFVLIGISQFVGLALSLVVIHRLGFVFRPRLSHDILQMSKRYSSSVYMASVLNLLPPTLLPLIIVSQLGPENAAYYYMAFTIAGVLYTVSYASMQSAFAEGSHDETALKSHITKAAKLIGVLLIPAIVFVTIFSGRILQTFGNAYAVKGSFLLRLFALGALPVAAYSALGAIFKITQNLRGVVIMNGIYAVAILGLSYFWIPQFGVVAIGWSWVLGNVAAVAIGFVFLNLQQHKRIGDAHGKASSVR